MRQMLMGIWLLVALVVLNPPIFLSEILKPSIDLYATTPKIISNLKGVYPNFKVIINIPATELKLFDGDELIQRFPIAIGQRMYPTPVQMKDHFKTIVWNPWWLPPDSKWAKDEKPTPPGPNNPLGVVKLPLSDGILVHGTNEEKSIGEAASHACIRMRNEDAKTLAWTLQSSLTPLFEEANLEKYSKRRGQSFWVSLGLFVPVEFIYEPIEIKEKEVILHKDIYGKIKDKRDGLINKLLQEGISLEKLNWNHFSEIVKKWSEGKKVVTLLKLLQDPLSNPQNPQSRQKSGRENLTILF